MSLPRLETYVDRIIVSGERAMQYMEGMDRITFRTDPIRQDAVIANIMAIGECVTKIMDNFPDFASDHPEIPWRDIKNMRNRIAHQYFQLDINTIWVTIDLMIPELVSQLSGVRNQHAQGE